MSKGKEEIRTRARLEREERKRKERRSRMIFQGGIVSFVLAVIVIIVLVVSVGSSSGTILSPANMASGGVRIEGNKLSVAQSTADTKSEIITPPIDSKKVDIRVYIDYQCTSCQQFEQAYGDYLINLVKQGKVVLEYHPIAILDRLSQGTEYSTRAATASACVADTEPDKWLAYNKVMYTNQPAEGSSGLSNLKLVALARDAGVSNLDAVSSCITKQKYAKWVTQRTKDALEDVPLINQPLSGTPTVIVDGKKFDSTTVSFSDYVQAEILKKSKG